MLSQLSFPRILILFFLTGPTFCKAQCEGSECTVNGTPGNCTRFQDCPSILKATQSGQYPRIVYGYSGYEPIVCCPIPTTIEQTTSTTTTTASPKPGWAKAKRMCKYYHNSIPKYILGGTRVTRAEFTFMVAVGYNTDGTNKDILWLCGGSLISDKFVLTAAHCIELYNYGRLKPTWVLLGALNLLDENALKSRISERIIHPDYRPPSNYHDIGLLKLEQRIAEFGPFIQPACLVYAFPDTDPELRPVAMGWGQVEWAGERSNDLLKVDLTLVPQSQCNKSYTSGVKDDNLQDGIVHDWQLCASGLGKDTCQGDSGGPLATYLRPEEIYRYNIIGVTSIGKLCGSIVPGVYTRVFNYVPWIQDIVWPDEEYNKISGPSNI